MNPNPTRILIVEDDDALRETLLDTAGYAGLDASGARMASNTASMLAYFMRM